jgi:hypothetical protein
MSQIGLERGGHSIQKCREKFRSILSLLVEIGGLQVDLFFITKNIGIIFNFRLKDQSNKQKS